MIKIFTMIRGITKEFFVLALFTVAFDTGVIARCTNKLDIVFGLPNSASLGDGFRDTKQAISRLVDRYEVKNTGTHIGVVSYNERAHSALPLDQAYNARTVQNFIDQVPVSETHGFNTAAAINAAADHAFSMFGGVRETQPKVFVLFAPIQTTSSLEDLKAAAGKLKGNGVRLVVVGVGGSASEETYSSVVTQPPSRFLINAVSYGDFNPALDAIENTTCTVEAGKCPVPGSVASGGAPCEVDRDCVAGQLCCSDGVGGQVCSTGIITYSAPFEMAIAIDNSEAATAADFLKMKSFVHDLMLPYANSENNAHFGLISFAGTTHKLTNGFRKFRSEQELNRMIDSLPKTQDPQRRLDLTFEAAGREMFSMEGGTRHGFSRYLLVVAADGTSPGSGSLKEAARSLDSMGVKRIAVAASDDVPPTFLQDVPSDSSLAFKAKEASELPKIATDIQRIINNEKPGLCPVVDPIDPGLCPTNPDPIRIPCKTPGSRESDWGCPGEQKCCMDSSGCGSYCTDPPLACNKDREIVVLLENTDAIGDKRSFELMKDMASKLIGAFNISRQNTHVAIGTYTGSSRSVIRFKDRDTYNKKAAQARIMNVPFQGGSYGSTKAALDAAVQAFNPATGVRPDMNKSVVIIGSGYVRERDRARGVAQELRTQMVDIYAVTIGNRANYDAMREIVSQETAANVFTVTSADALAAQLRPLVDTVCRGAMKDLTYGTG